MPVLLSYIMWFSIIFIVVKKLRSKRRHTINSSTMQRNDNQEALRQTVYKQKNEMTVNKPSDSSIPNKMPSQIKKEEGSNSTMDYLDQKAREDQKQHEAEKLKQQIKMRMKYGDAKFGQRHILGDEIPSGMYFISCGYCGAENLLPSGQKKEYNCYFCREEL